MDKEENKKMVVVTGALPIYDKVEKFRNIVLAESCASNKGKRNKKGKHLKDWQV